MPARYYLRLDDACATMKADSWSVLESVLDETGIRPVVGVIPDSRDPELLFDSADENFWALMRGWQAKGWELVLHGLHHRYHLLPAAARPIITMSEKSEFVGLSLEAQKQMLERGAGILAGQGIQARAFMAPSHSLDRTTLDALKKATNIEYITDGHSFRPYRKFGFTWIPQQLWRFRAAPFGLWGICIHPNTITSGQLQKLVKDLRLHKDKFVSFDEIIEEKISPMAAADTVFARLFVLGLALKTRLRSRGEKALYDRI